MVVLVVKGTKYPDEFTVQRPLTAAIDAETAETGDSQGSSNSNSSACVARSVCRILNARHHLRLLLLSAAELEALAPAGPSREGYRASVAQLTERLKDRAAPVEEESEFDAAVVSLRAATAALFPSYCVHPDGAAAAVARLWQQHEDPDLPETERLMVYHCRALMDPEWRSSEREPEATAALWFCGKPMRGTLAQYCGRNDKSRLTVKVAPATGPAPSGEPRMSYEDQRAVFARLRERREELKTLEESELRDRVVRQARGQVQLQQPVQPEQLNTAGLRPIHAKKEERVLDVSS